ncbi:hypothetical protein FACS1894153_3810 [Bacteroidia bacterium]|nr:hypothetical protein FACS1894153_3810 [Bacteroidia bacterium]
MNRISILALTIVACAIILCSCNQGKIESLELELQHLKTEKRISDSLQDSFFEVMNEIEENVSAIKSKSGSINEAKTESTINQKDKILKDIEDINKMMDINRRKLADLENLKRKLAEVNNQNNTYAKLVEDLKAKIEAYEQEIAKLKEDLSAANEKITVLTDENTTVKQDNATKAQKIEEQENVLNTAYFVIGTQKDLTEKNIILRKGGFIGIGKSTFVNSEAPLSSLNKIDIRTLNNLETGSAKPQLLSVHSANSFKWDQTDPTNLKLEITNSAEFWRQAKVCVIVIK